MSQSKNYEDLSKVSSEFTEEVLKKILCKAFDGMKVQLTDWNFGEEFTKGDSYLSTISKGKLYGDNEAKQRVQVNLIIKSIPKNVARRKTLRSTDFFSNEITVYTKIFPKFKKFLMDKGRTDFLCVPRHYFSYEDGTNDFIVLEDVSPLGFGPASRQNCVNWAECTVMLEAMAKFHAISFAYKDQKKEEFAELMSYLKETYFGEHNWNWYKKFQRQLINIAKHALTTEYPNSKAENQFNSYKFGVLYDKCTELCEKKDGLTSVLCEGDCWAPNFLVRDNDQNQKEALMLDFQLGRCTSPITDLSFLVYSCTLKPFRDQYFDAILKTYHTVLSDAIKSLGSDPEKMYPWHLFMKEVKENFFFGVVFALEAIPFAILDPSQSFDLDTLMTGDERVEIADVWKLENIKTSSGRRRLADVIVHAVENGYL